jgi:hypothetical protein
MSDRHVVVYTSPEADNAARLCQHLHQVGIQAQVIAPPKPASDRSAATTNHVQVIVSESDEMVAQQIAMEFDRPELHHGCAVVDVVVDAREQATIDAWPTCPECGRKRHTMCPICETAGTEFPPGDAISGGDETDLEGTDDPGDPLGRQPLLCPTCDEPFIPNYLRECEWCNFDFGHGVEKPFAFHESFEPVNWRVWTLIGVLAAFAGLIILWMKLVMRD